MTRHSSTFADAMARCIGRDTATIASAVGYARRTVASWKEPKGDSRQGPAKRCPARLLRDLALASMDAGRDLHDAVAPVHAVATSLGFELRRRVTDDELGEERRHVGRVLGEMTSTIRRLERRLEIGAGARPAPAMTNEGPGELELRGAGGPRGLRPMSGTEDTTTERRAAS